VHDEVRHDRQHVEDVHHVEAELSLGRTGDQSEQELNAEPRHADRLHHVERILHDHVPHGAQEKNTCIHACIQMIKDAIRDVNKATRHNAEAKA